MKGTRLAQSVQRVTFHLRVLSLSCMLNLELTLKKEKTKSNLTDG